MNKSILILICNFLLLSVLALAWFDATEAEEKARAHAQAATPSGPGSEPDMIDALKSALEQERLAGQRLDALLRQTQSNLATSQTALAEREEQLRQTGQKLTRQEEEARKMVAAQALLQETLDLARGELAKAQQENAANQKKMAALQRLQLTSQANLESLERRHAATQAELEGVQNRFKASIEDIAALQKKLTSAEAEIRVNEQLVQELERELRERVQGSPARTQPAEPPRPQQNLAPGGKQTKALLPDPVAGPNTVPVRAVPSGKPAAETGPAGLLGPNSIFSDYTSNRLQSTFLATRSGFLGKSVEKSAIIPTLLFSDGKQNYVVYHVRETPFEFTAVGTEWERMTVTVAHGKVVCPLTKLGFLDQDPRILISEIAGPQAAQLGARIYRVADNLFKVEEAVLVGVKEDYCGECVFRIDPDTPGYLRLQRERFGRVVGKLAPSRGDLVLSRAGDVIGIMANNEYCLVFDRLKTARTVALGDKVPKQLTAAYLSQMYFQLEDLPVRLR